MSALDNQRDFDTQLYDKLGALPSEPGEYWADAKSVWIDGIYADSDHYRQNSNTIVAVSRFASNDPGFGEPVIEHVVRIERSYERENPLEMTPEAAVVLGRHLLVAGTAAIRDLAAHANWLAHEHPEVPK
ncbi:Uncharacterised protein (plasmid) [Tsukamurella tyrosinosolvens]|uniref:Uncharacterized protein n=1 Tax=Tsukamurella tyrosinosolvens TaxID=57704 RepID=A0A1H4WPN1_TSUTY|nr:hypothetical protein [Tsukamurella tyrosinosolvens]KXO99677.1 hypothetical protein AXK58_00140 [Tsukamurella tyrosinosolvens]SEC94504.1 hypothetical protein SAMN04489793_3612 [Tsukamurella tyrosinosolvens]VEH89456.1 Uncharacterised protein [Tsukamurella tyrosinosolvens]